MNKKYLIIFLFLLQNNFAQTSTNIFPSDGNVGIGTLSPDNQQNWQKVVDVYASAHAKLLVRSNLLKTGIFSDQSWGSKVVGRIGTESNHDLWLMAGYGNFVMTLGTDGNVGIGNTNPTNKLDVNGTIHSKEVKVDLLNWPDYVFKKEYNLPTLEEIEQHIIKEGHLENIPTEKEVLKDGVNLGEINAKLLQKIEELTLYAIEQNKKISNLEKRLEKIEKK
ncbi:hypothetical protein [Flavobacterium sp. DG2-3]|uniref:hypothetical protein n=1 Tax=Flavobacterium sp. DG2-3 TaxID=3068317 RepID=UPI00273DA141|nr:hypothetical protein [Flavobacterium sp. DG2-3]MDP5201623.1 hypothetical protein [Flavobacterium sp. DG2-3]